jgi:hypothetical protein
MNSRCGNLHSVAQGRSIDVVCPSLQGRYVHIGIQGSQKILTLCEVEVRAATHGATRISVREVEVIAEAPFKQDFDRDEGIFRVPQDGY